MKTKKNDVLIATPCTNNNIRIIIVILYYCMSSLNIAYNICILYMHAAIHFDLLILYEKITTSPSSFIVYYGKCK